MPQYIYDIFCWNENKCTGVQKKILLFGQSLEQAKSHFMEHYDSYVRSSSNPIFQYKHYTYMYRYEFEPTGVVDARNHMIYRPKYSYEYDDILSIIRDRQPCRIIDEDMMIL